MTGGVAARLEELGLSLPDVAAPVAAYVPAVWHGDLVWTSGQLPIVDGELVATGLVADPALVPAAGSAAAGPAGSGARAGSGVAPELVSPDRAAELARICALNALAAVRSVIGDLDRLERVVKLVGFVASHPTFTGQPRVVDGASRLLGEVLGDAGRHARSAVGVAVLPLNSPVEIELVAAVR